MHRPFSSFFYKFISPNTINQFDMYSLSASHDVLFDKRMIWFSGLDC